MFIVWYPRKFSRLYNLHPWYWNSLLYGLISSGENSTHFLQLMPFTIFHFFIPPGTHYCWVGKGSMEWEVLPDTSTHDQQWEFNLRPSDLVQHPIHLVTCPQGHIQWSVNKIMISKHDRVRLGFKALLCSCKLFLKFPPSRNSSFLRTQPRTFTDKD